MSNAPVCHISTNQLIIDQPEATLLPSVPIAVDLPSALKAIAALKLLLQMLSGQQSFNGAGGFNGQAGLRGSAGVAGSSGKAGAPGKAGKAGKDGKPPRFVEDRSARVKKKVRVFQDNDDSSDNWVDIERIDRVVWVDQVTGQRIEWSR